MIAPGAADLRLTKTTATIECPKSMVGRVIGKNGETIKALQTYTGSLIQVNQADNPCQITISGSPQSLSLAVSMVADIVKGTFKGFALLRQVATTGSARVPAPVIQAPHVQVLPVYAPGYGLVPPSQLYGGEDRVSIAGGQGNALPPGLTWSAPGYGLIPPSQLYGGEDRAPGAVPLNQGGTLPAGLAWNAVGGVQAQGLLDLQSVNQRAYSAANGSSGLLSAPMPVYSMPVGRGQYGGMAQELTGMMPSEALIYQGSGARYASGMPSSEAPQMGTSRLIQATGPPNQPSQVASWLPQGVSGSSSGPNASFGMGELGAEHAGSSLPGAAGNLVMDANGQVFYINSSSMLN